MKISVVVPVYDTPADFLRNCLESLRLQTHRDLEIIIVDDGSSSSDTIRAYSDFAASEARARVIRRANGGVSSARNAGLAAAAGDFVHFMDSDDFLESEFYAKLAAAVGRCAPDADAASGRLRAVGSARAVIADFDGMSGPFVCSGFFAKYHMLGYFRDSVSACTYIFRRAFLTGNDIRFDEKMKFCEDLDFLLRAIPLSGRIVCVPGALYLYCLNPASATADIRRVPFSELIPANETRLRFIKEHGDTPLPFRLTVRRIVLLGIQVASIARIGDGRVELRVFGLRIAVVKEQRLNNLAGQERFVANHLAFLRRNVGNPRAARAFLSEF